MDLSVFVYRPTILEYMEFRILSFSSIIVLSVLSTEAGTLRPPGVLGSPIILCLAMLFDGSKTVNPLRSYPTPIIPNLNLNDQA